MNARSLLITHAGGIREVESYSVPKLERAFARSPRTTVGSAWAFAHGDGMPLPGVLTVEALVNEASLASSYAFAEAVAQEARTATQVSTHYGVASVSGLRSWHATPAGGAAVRIVLEFLPTREAAGTLVTFGGEPVTFGSELVTFGGS